MRKLLNIRKMTYTNAIQNGRYSAYRFIIKEFTTVRLEVSGSWFKAPGLNTWGVGYTKGNQVCKFFALSFCL